MERSEHRIIGVAALIWVFGIGGCGLIDGGAPEDEGRPNPPTDPQEQVNQADRDTDDISPPVSE